MQSRLDRTDAVEGLIIICGKLLTELRNAKVMWVKFSCGYLPITENGMPLMGLLSNINRAFIAIGHSCWGIQNAPASGEAMAE